MAIKTEARKLSGTWKESIDQNRGGSWGHGGLSERRANNDDRVWSGWDFVNELLPFPQLQEEDELEM